VKQGFARSEPIKPPPGPPQETVTPPTPLTILPPEGKSLVMVAVAIGVIGLVVGLVVVLFASGARSFATGGAAMSFFPLMMVGSMAFMLFNRGGKDMPKTKLDVLRAQFLLMIDHLRAVVSGAADVMDTSYRWYHPEPSTLEAAVGSPRMWERKPDGKDTWFGVARVGIGMTNLVEAGVVEWREPSDMPTDIELEPATGKVLEEFVRAQSAAYGTPALISLLVEPGYELRGPRERVLGLMRSIVCQLVFSHGPDHLQLIVVTSDRAQWDWVKWLPHACDPNSEDGAGPVRMVYRSATEFVAVIGDLLRGRGQFTARHGASREPISVRHTVMVCDTDEDWGLVGDPDGVDGVTFFDLRGVVPACANPQRVLHIDTNGVISAVPRDQSGVPRDEGRRFFAVSDQVGVDDAEALTERMARWRLAQAYESFSEALPVLTRRDILAHYGIDDPADIDFDALWGARRDALGRCRLRVPFGNRSDNGELLFLDMKSLDEGGDGPHGVMSGTTGSGKSTLVRTVIESLMLAHPPEELQFVLADLKGGAAVKPFEGVPHVSRIITDLEEDQALMERFLEAMWGEIARRKAVCDSAGVDDAREYNEIRGRMRARGQDMAPLPMLVVVIDEFYEWFRIMPTAVDVLDSIGRQGRAYWIHLVMASQTIESRAEKLMENMGYRLVLKARTAGAAQAAGVPAAVNLPAKAGLGYFRKSLEEIIRFQAEFMWRDYHRPGTEDLVDDGGGAVPSSFFAPKLFTTEFVPIDTGDEIADVPLDGEVVNDEIVDADADAEEDEEDADIRTPKVGTVIIDQLRRIDFEPYRLWQPPLDVSVAVDELVNRFLARPWQQNYGSARDLVFPIGVIDRPFKHDQPPWTVDTSGPGANVLILGAGGAGKTTALQTLICSAALTHTPEQVQFYCLAYSGTALMTVAGLPHVGGVAGPTDPDGVRRTIAEVLGLVRERKRSFIEHQIASMEVLRRRKFGGEPGPVPDDGFGDVYLVLDNYRALAEENEVLIEQVNQVINQGPSFGVHVVVTADRESELRPPVRSGFGSRVELRLAAVEDAKLVRSRFAKDVPPKPGRGMVAVNYVRLDGDPQSGLHTLVARPALGATQGFESSSVAAAVVEWARGSAKPVRRLPARFGLEQLRALAADDTRQGVGAGGIAWAISELDLQPVYLNFAENAHLMVTGRRECGRTTTLATIMSEIGRIYAPGASSAPPSTRPSAQVWLVDPRRQLLRVLGSDYTEKFAYNVDGVAKMMDEFAAVLARREPPPGLSAEELLSRSWWSGPEIFLIIDDLQQLPPGFDSPLHKAAAWVTRAADVGLHVFMARGFGGWSSAGSDPMLRALHQANAPLLVMDADADEGFIRAKMKGGPLPHGRGLLMAEDTGIFVQVAATELHQ
jgi:type VII secretion protein EccCa/type VII secretion protein EccCb